MQNAFKGYFEVGIFLARTNEVAMKTARKFLIGYLIVTSVILHLIVCIAFFQLLPAMRLGMEMGEEFALASTGRAKNVGVVKDICVVQDGDYTYHGFSVEYDGKLLYTMGTDLGIKTGDTVAVTISKHPYGPLKSLMVLVTENGS